jgi:excisionase family DNA binding protein
MKNNHNSEPVRRLLVKPKEAAEMLAISERTLANLKASGDIKAIKVGAAVIYSIKELERWIERKLQEGGEG